MYCPANPTCRHASPSSAHTAPDHPYTQITMRRAQVSDHRRIESFQAAALRIHAKHHYERGLIDRYIAEAGTMPQDMLHEGHLFVLEYHGEIIATGGWRWQADDGAAATGLDNTPRQTGPLNGTYAEISSLYVDPFFARIGLASWLIATIEADIARLGLTDVRITATLTGLPMCQKNGYQPYRLSPVALTDGTHFQTVALAKALSPLHARQQAARNAPLHATLM